MNRVKIRCEKKCILRKNPMRKLNHYTKVYYMCQMFTHVNFTPEQWGFSVREHFNDLKSKTIHKRLYTNLVIRYTFLKKIITRSSKGLMNINTSLQS